jgi:dihydropteroate synthase
VGAPAALGDEIGHAPAVRPLTGAGTLDAMAPLVMGVLNVTPDSFSDGGRFLDPDRAIAHGLALVAEGADVVDVGGESTRPGAAPVDEGEERRRVVPVVQALAPHVRVSVDTTKASVAWAAVEAGATLVNDVSASLHAVAAEAGVGWVAMHMQGTPASMQEDPSYDNVVAEVRSFLVARAEAAVAAGVGEVWIDPGIGFGKQPHHNLLLLRDLATLVAAGYPVLVGTSRKSFLGALAGGAGPDDRLEGSVATATLALVAGAAMVRVHDVAATVAAARLLGGRAA